jgi:hypothetical protein
VGDRYIGVLPCLQRKLMWMQGWEKEGRREREGERVFTDKRKIHGKCVIRI